MNKEAIEYLKKEVAAGRLPTSALHQLGEVTDAIVAKQVNDRKRWGR